MKLRITLQGNTYEVDVDVIDGGTPAAAGSVPTLRAPVQRLAQPAPQPVPETAVVGEKACRAPIPGNIVGVKVTVGQAIQANDVVVVLEAMKMETPIHAPVSGKVKSVLVEVGSSVKQGQLLVEFE